MANIILTITRSKTLLRAIGIALDSDKSSGVEKWTRYNGSCLDDLPIALARADLVLLDIGSFKGNLDARSKNHIKALASRQALLFLHGEEDKILLQDMSQWTTCLALEKPFNSEDLDAAMQATLGDKLVEVQSDLTDALGSSGLSSAELGSLEASTVEIPEPNATVSTELLSGRRARPAFEEADSGEPIEGPKFVGEESGLETGLNEQFSTDSETLSEFAKLKKQAEKRAAELSKPPMDRAEAEGDFNQQLIDKVSSGFNADSKEIQTHLRKMVEQYCQENFSRIARQVLEEELQKNKKEQDRIRYGDSQA